MSQQLRKPEVTLGSLRYQWHTLHDFSFQWLVASSYGDIWHQKGRLNNVAEVQDAKRLLFSDIFARLHHGMWSTAICAGAYVFEVLDKHHVKRITITLPVLQLSYSQDTNNVRNDSECGATLTSFVLCPMNDKRVLQKSNTFRQQ